MKSKINVLFYASILAVSAGATTVSVSAQLDKSVVIDQEQSVNLLPSLSADWDNSIPFIRDAEDGGIFVGNLHFDSWDDYFVSDFFQQNNLRCGTPFAQGFEDPNGSPADCSYNSTNPSAEYDPSVALYRIPVVFHIIRADNGTTGNVSEELVRSQVDVLNEDFLAILGSNGQNGTDCQVEFYLATEDPNGNPTNGITYTNNTQWYNDSGTYYNTLAWDPYRYLNIYSNTASGALGYVPWLPQNGSVGSKADRVVILWSTVGYNSPYGFPYNLGRTTTHEVGHFLGLFHTFEGGCTNSNCSTNNDRICDTNPESSAHFGCGSRTTCGSLDPIENYMDYSDDRCMDNFTPNQARRIRCTMEFYRPDVYSLGGGTANNLAVSPDPLIAGQNGTFSVTSANPNVNTYLVYSLKGAGSTYVPSLNITLDLKQPTQAGGAVKSDANGDAQWVLPIPGAGAGKNIWFQACQYGVTTNVVATSIQ